MENPAQLIRSWNLQTSFAGGKVVDDKLVPRPFTRIRTPFVQTWREEQVNSNLDWESRGFSFYLPESLRVISSMYLQINLPALNGDGYKSAPGLYAVDQIRFLTAGQEAYTVDVGLYLRDYIESLESDHAQEFAETYLGGFTTGTTDARTVLIPILLPNSAYLTRKTNDRHGKGIFPCYLGQNRLEVQITMNSASNMVTDATHAPGSISGACSMMFHQVDMKADDVLRYSDVRGAYSVVSRRFTEITDGWTQAQSGNIQNLTNNQPIGTVTELFCLAVPFNATAERHEILNLVDPNLFEIISDSVVQKSLNTPAKIRIEKWTNGFTTNIWAKVAGRLCFAAHCADAEEMYSGGFSTKLSSQINVRIRFPAHVSFRVYAVQLQRITISPMGLIQSSLE